jgi:hypothetical protein
MKIHHTGHFQHLLEMAEAAGATEVQIDGVCSFVRFKTRALADRFINRMGKAPTKMGLLKLPSGGFAIRIDNPTMFGS